MVALILASALTFQDVKPIFERRCSGCHHQWQIYENAYSRRNMIRHRVWVVKDMPPGNVRGITDAEREAIRDWVDQGAKK